MDELERQCWIALAMTPGIGARRHKHLVATFGSARAAWLAPLEELAAAGLGEKGAAGLCTARGDTPEAAAAGATELAEAGAWQVICLPQQEYPALLREIYDPPATLWVKGTIPAGPAVAIVGSRRATPYGLRVARQLAEDLAEAGVTVISGLARGIDTAGHRGALAGGGRTVAVLGCGIDQVYPPENAALHEEIADRGALVSELPPGSEPSAGNFPARNRIISGLAAATVVVEAGERSGALITADLAGEQGRDVMAVPGNITSPGSVGCNRLIADGARLVLSAADILDQSALLPPAVRSRGGREAAGEAESQSAETLGDSRWDAVLAAITDCGVSIDEIVSVTGLGTAEILAALTSLQLSGRIEAIPGGRFVSFSRQRR